MAISKLASNASLRQVMDKFEEISLMDFSSNVSLAIDIITASSLPSTVKNGRIVVVTNTTPTNIIFDYKAPASKVHGDLFIQTYAQDLKKFEIKSDNKKVILNIKNVSQYLNGSYSIAKAYLGVNGSWVPLFDTKLYLFDNGNQYNATTGGYGTYVTKGQDIRPYVNGYANDSALSFIYTNTANNDQSNAYISTAININFSSYSTLKIEFESNLSPVAAHKIYIEIYLGDTLVGSFVPSIANGPTVSINVSSINSSGILKLYAHKGGAYGTSGEVHISKMWLE